MGQVLEQDLVGSRRERKGPNPLEAPKPEEKERLLSLEARCSQELVQTGPPAQGKGSLSKSSEAPKLCCQRILKSSCEQGARKSRTVLV